jgi:hypothetical protein
LRGPASGTYKNGEHSRYLKSIPRKLRQAYDTQMADPNLRGTRSEIALTQLRVDELLGRLDKSPLPSWQQLMAAVSAIGRTRTQDDYDNALQVLFDLIRTGAGAVGNYEKTWRELRELFQERGQLVKIEHRITQDASTTLAADQVLVLVSGLLQAVEDVVLTALGNKEVYRRIVGRALLYLPPEAREAAQ